MKHHFREFVLNLTRADAEQKKERLNGNKRKRSVDVSAGSAAGPSKIRRESDDANSRTGVDDQVEEVSIEVDEIVPSPEPEGDNKGS